MTFFEEGKNWVKDSNGNRCSVEQFGSEAAAQRALASLEDCVDCVDCRDCIGCVDCSDCRDCRDCRDCYACRDCLSCHDCIDCGACLSCLSCRRCSACSYCNNCSKCFDCSHCGGCSDCRDCRGPKFYGYKMRMFVVPKIENIHRTIYAAASNPASLNMDVVHSCADTHCRGGWTTVLAGPEGEALEDFLGWEVAAMAIYAASGYQISPNRFYDSNSKALADMQRLAEEEAANAAQA